MGKILVTLREEHLWQGSNANKSEKVYSYEGVEQVLQRTDIITHREFGSGIEILRIVDSESEQVAGSFVRNTVKYMRFSHVSGSSDCELLLTRDNEDQGVMFTLTPGNSIILGNEQIATSNVESIVDVSYVDFTYFSKKDNFDSVKARGIDGDIKLEYVIASS